MGSIQLAELRERLLPQAIALVERATAETSNSQIVEALLETCCFLEESSHSNAPIVAVERDVHSEAGTYHLTIRRLYTSVPVGKFQIIITRELASGLIY